MGAIVALSLALSLVGAVLPGTTSAQAASKSGVTLSSKKSVPRTAKTVTVKGAFPATVKVGGKAKELSVYLMWCVNPGKKRATGTGCVEKTPMWVVPKGSKYSKAKLGKMRVTTAGTIKKGKWAFTAKMPVSAKVGKKSCFASGKPKCGVFVRLSNHAGPTNKAYDQFIPVKFAPPAKPALRVAANKSKTKATVTVKVRGVSRPTGTVKVTVGKKSVSVKVKASKKGKVSVKLPKLAKGSNKVKVRFSPSGSTKKVSKTGSKTFTIKK